MVPQLCLPWLLQHALPIWASMNMFIVGDKRECRADERALRGSEISNVPEDSKVNFIFGSVADDRVLSKLPKDLENQSCTTSASQRLLDVSCNLEIKPGFTIQWFAVRINPPDQ